jgi:hypothetical protein
VFARQFVIAWLVTAGGVAGRAAAAPPFAGFDLELTLTETSGVVFLPEAYANQLGVAFAPRYALGERWFRGRWAQPLSLSAAFLLSHELTGNDPRFRGGRFPSAALFQKEPDRLGLIEGQVDGTGRRLAPEDLSFSLAHPKIYELLGGAVVAHAELKVVLPTSGPSLLSGLLAAPSAALGARWTVGPVEVGYVLRGTQYFFSTPIAPIAPLMEPVIVNGQEVEPYRPSSSTSANPSFGLANALSVSAELPHRLSASVEYTLIHTVLSALLGCAVEGVPTADLCRDGAELGYVQTRGQRDSGAFAAEVGWRAQEGLALALGLSTFRPVRLPDGQLANPLWSLTRDNATTVYLSATFGAAALLASPPSTAAP